MTGDIKIDFKGQQSEDIKNRKMLWIEYPVQISVSNLNAQTPILSNRSLRK